MEDDDLQLKLDFFLHDDDEVTMVFSHVPLDRLKDLFDHIGTEEWQRHILDGVNAQIAGRDLGIGSTMREFSVSFNKEDDDEQG